MDRQTRALVKFRTPVLQRGRFRSRCGTRSNAIRVGRSAMKKPIFLCAVLNVLMIAGAAHAQSRSLPTFEVDRSWPKIPPQWKLGDPSSIAIDAKDNVWVLHRPRTLKPEDAAKAAPLVIVFDTAGT